MNKVIPLAKPLRPSCIWSLEDLGTVEVIEMDKERLEMVYGFVRPQNKEEARHWVELGEAGKLRTTHFLEVNVCYPNDPIYEAQLLSSKLFWNGEIYFTPRCCKLYNDLGIDEFVDYNPSFTPADVIEPMAIDLQVIPRRYWELTIDWVKTYCSEDYIDDLNLQLKNLLDTNKTENTNEQS
jgi:hypothetical protein